MSVTLIAYQHQEQQDAVIIAFTEYDDRAQVLITTYVAGPYDMNLQQKC